MIDLDVERSKIVFALKRYSSAELRLFRFLYDQGHVPQIEESFRKSIDRSISVFQMLFVFRSSMSIVRCDRRVRRYVLLYVRVYIVSYAYVF